MSEGEQDGRDEHEPQGRSERQDNKLADVLAVAEEHEPDAEKSKYLHGMRARAEVRAGESRRTREDR